MGGDLGITWTWTLKERKELKTTQGLRWAAGDSGTLLCTTCESRILSRSLLCPQHPSECLERSRCSVNIC